MEMVICRKSDGSIVRRSDNPTVPPHPFTPPYPITSPHPFTTPHSFTPPYSITPPHPTPPLHHTPPHHHTQPNHLRRGGVGWGGGAGVKLSDYRTVGSSDRLTIEPSDLRHITVMYQWLSKQFLNMLMLFASTKQPGRLFQIATILFVRKCLRRLYLQWFWYHLCLFPRMIKSLLKSRATVVLASYFGFMIL